MSVEDIKAEFGTVVGQLLEYRYAAVPEQRRSKGLDAALTSAKGWVESILMPGFQPRGNIVEAFHIHDTADCDAVQLRYSAGAAWGESELWVSQTIFIITVVVVPKLAPEKWRSGGAEAASETARVLFQQGHELDLQLDKRAQGVWLGHQAVPNTKARDQIGWLDTLRWWIDGNTMGFSVLKRVPGGSARVSLDLQPNQAWFRMYEEPRFR